jgi:cytochrome c oxidase subunit 2
VSARRRVVTLAAAAFLATLVAGCVPGSATAEGRDIGALYLGANLVAAAVGLFVAGLITWSILRYRRRAGDDTLPPQHRGHLGLELVWTGIPVLIVIGLFAATVVVLARVESTDAEPGASIEVTAFRWGWTFAYPAEDVTISGIGVPGPEVVVPAGEPVRLTLQSADVVHSLYVPEFLFKRDVNPGHVNTFQFTVEEPGSYGGLCAEFCGIYHSQMPFVLRAVPRAEYDAWLAEQRAAGGSPSPVPSEPLPAEPSP